MISVSKGFAFVSNLWVFRCLSSCDAFLSVGSQGSSVGISVPKPFGRWKYVPTYTSQDLWHVQTSPRFAVPENREESSYKSFSRLYGLLWMYFLVYGIFLSPGKVFDPSDTKIIETLVNDPSNVAGAMNPLFFVVFNALGIMPIIMAQLALPQGNKKGVWAAPFVLGSFGAGYGALGLYLTFREPPVQHKSKTEASWITRNVLESKIFNWIVVALCVSVLFSSGILTGGGTLGEMVETYKELATQSKLVAVSTIDLLILTVSAATLIPCDYCLRVEGETEDDPKLLLAAASTALLPVFGAALYCALRPSLPEDQDTLQDTATTTTTKDPPNQVTDLFRRTVLNAVVRLGSSAYFFISASPAVAMSQEEQDKTNILKGYQRLQYLLDNWEKETTICGMGGDKLETSCERTPPKVMEYLGYKTTNDPLFKAEKTLRRLYPLAPTSRDGEFIEAVDRYVENADEASSMAYIASWGEANPGGGKDRVELFIERARKNVIVARDSLATVIDILGL